MLFINITILISFTLSLGVEPFPQSASCAVGIFFTICRSTDFALFVHTAHKAKDQKHFKGSTVQPRLRMSEPLSSTRNHARLLNLLRSNFLLERATLSEDGTQIFP